MARTLPLPRWHPPARPRPGYNTTGASPDPTDCPARQHAVAMNITHKSGAVLAPGSQAPSLVRADAASAAVRPSRRRPAAHLTQDMRPQAAPRVPKSLSKHSAARKVISRRAAAPDAGPSCTPADRLLAAVLRPPAGTGFSPLRHPQVACNVATGPRPTFGGEKPKPKPVQINLRDEGSDGPGALAAPEPVIARPRRGAPGAAPLGGVSPATLLCPQSRACSPAWTPTAGASCPTALMAASRSRWCTWCWSRSTSRR